MKASEKAFELIKKFEGLRLDAYLCSAGKWTIGYGSRKGVESGMRITLKEANERLALDIKDAEDAIERRIRVLISQNQYDALTSFIFNFGETKFIDSTLLKRINASDPSASEEFMRWVYERNPATMKMKKNPGLMRRRKAEKALYDSSSLLS